MIEWWQLWVGILVVAPLGTLAVLAMIALGMRFAWRRGK